MLRHRVRQAIEHARRELYIAGRNDRMRALAGGQYRNVLEALEDLESAPTAITEADVDAVLEGYVGDAESIRHYVHEHGDSWPERVRERWAGYASRAEQREREVRS